MKDKKEWHICCVQQMFSRAPFFVTKKEKSSRTACGLSRLKGEK